MKRPKINKKEAGVGPFFYKSIVVGIVVGIVSIAIGTLSIVVGIVSIAIGTVSIVVGIVRNWHVKKTN